MERRDNVIAIGEAVIARGRYRFRTYRAGTKELLRVTPWIKNLLVTASGHGLNIVARRLCNDLTYDRAITQAKIGTGTTTPAVTDTDLETPVTDSIPVANQAASGGVATLEFFIPDALLPDGTYEEFGIFCGDQLFARSLITPSSYSKAENEDTACDYEIEFSNT